MMKQWGMACQGMIVAPKQLSRQTFLRSTKHAYAKLMHKCYIVETKDCLRSSFTRIRVKHICDFYNCLKELCKGKLRLELY